MHRETAEESVSATLAFVEGVRKLGSPMVMPTITPRFALSCSKELLKSLGDIAKRFDLHIQSHISENLEEIEMVKGIFKTSYAGAYDEAGLLTNKVNSFRFQYVSFLNLYYLTDCTGSRRASGGRRGGTS